MNKRWTYTLLLAAGIGTMSGCDPLTREHFDMITLHHAEKYDVEKTIGPPDKPTLNDLWTYTRPDKHLTVKIHYGGDGKVVRKEWIDAMTQEWYDTEEAPADSSSSETTSIRKMDN